MWSTTAADALREGENEADALDKGWLAEGGAGGGEVASCRACLYKL
jgi:hypothetical protein